jgi:hypothetical protein
VLSRKQLVLLNGEEDDVGEASVRDANVLLLIAHPDDEAMFFVPTILAMRKRHKIHVLR